jgi:hypothetical protein
LENKSQYFQQMKITWGGLIVWGLYLI